MGVRHLETFIRQEVPNGYFRVNIQHAVQQYYNAASDSGLPAPAPVIVIDLAALHHSLTSIDGKLKLFGARLNVGFWKIDRFFARLKALGTELEFFLDGSVHDFKLPTWCERRDIQYQESIGMIDAVDRGIDSKTIHRQLGAPKCSYAVECLAKKHGRLTVSMEKECDQELAAFACKTKAMAIISNDTDFMIYDGDWRFWTCKEINIYTLETVEYNRPALLEYLGLNYSQMPLFATLCGNDIVKYEEVQYFHDYLMCLLPRNHKFINVAHFARHASTYLQHILMSIYGMHYQQIEERFRQSLYFYKTNYPATNPNPNNDPTVAVVLKQPNSFAYQLWHRQPYTVSFALCDMRSDSLGKQLPGFVLRILLRTAGIILFHRQKCRESCLCLFVIKVNHESNYRRQHFLVEFPISIEPPTLVDLFASDSTVADNLLDIKFQLLSWIVSDNLDYRKVKPVPIDLRATVLTLYLLVEQHVLQLFEADLLLQVAHDVVKETYHPAAVKIPAKLESRPFRLVFIYKELHYRISRAIQSVGLNPEGRRSDTPFDGVLFHSRYGAWSKGGADLTQIKQWRIYAVND